MPWRGAVAWCCAGAEKATKRCGIGGARGRPSRILGPTRRHRHPQARRSRAPDLFPAPPRRLQSGRDCAYTQAGFTCDVISCFNGAFDNNNPLCVPDPCAFDDITPPAGATQGGSAQCASGLQVPSGDECSYVLAGYSCQTATCTEGTFDITSPVCSPLPCPYDDLTISVMRAHGVALGSVRHRPLQATPPLMLRSRAVHSKANQPCPSTPLHSNTAGR